MSTEGGLPSQSSTEGERLQQKQLDRQIREMVNAITSRVGEIQKSSMGSHHNPHHHHQDVDQDEHGVRIVTLAGTNTGATMRTELDEKTGKPDGLSLDEAADELGTYVNSNYQAVNNSIMLGSSHNTNDPGVHLDISDVFEHHGPKPDKHSRKGKRKEKDAAIKSEPHSD